MEEIDSLSTSSLITLLSLHHLPRLVFSVNNEGFGVLHNHHSGVKAGLVESCVEFAVGVDILQCKLFSVYVSSVHRDSLAQI